jgi:hypothetical protein
MGHCVCINSKNIGQKYVNINDLGNYDSNEKLANSSFLDYKSRNKNGNITSPIYNKSTENMTFENSYEIKMLKEINFARTNPKEYAIKLKELTQCIIKEGDNEYLIPNKLNSNEKIFLRNGSKLFYDTIQYLNNLEPINQLEWNEDLKIKFDYNSINIIDNNLSTDRKSNILSSENIGKLVLNKRLELLQKYKKCYFNIDIFHDPILSVVFQITDDAFNQERRNAIFNKEFTNFAVNSIEDNKKNFISISSFAT